MARVELEQQRTHELRWILKQIEYLQQVVREGFEDFSERLVEIEEIILGSDYRTASLRRQLAINQKTLNMLQEEKALRAGEINISLDNKIESLKAEIAKIEDEVERIAS